MAEVLCGGGLVMAWYSEYLHMLLSPPRGDVDVEGCDIQGD